MRLLVVWTLLVLAGARPAAAQVSSRWYLGATLGANRVDNDETDTGSVGAAGATIGVRLTPVVSVELGLNRGFGKLSRSYEGFGVSFAPPGSPREDFERFGVYQRFDRDWTPTTGFSGVVVWRNPTPNRVTVAAFAGVSGVWYRERSLITNLRIPEGVDPNHPSLQRSVQVLTRNRGGLLGGAMVPIALANGISVAPEITFTYGSIGDEIYNVFGSSVRVLWRF